jgi:hypothetical protein
VSRVEDYRETLRRMPKASWTSYLDQHSGLPGPRANLSLLQAAADEGDATWLAELAGSRDEFGAATGAAGLGRLLAERPDEALEKRLHELAADPRWRVREGVAMALQRLGDVAPDRLWCLVRAWAVDSDPLVQRAAVAGICEPRLLRTRNGSAVSLEICSTVTRRLAAVPSAQRRNEAVRVLRQALGYCWSVAVAADPSSGLPLFGSLQADADPDVAWIVRENGKKARLRRLLEAGAGEVSPR